MGCVMGKLGETGRQDIQKLIAECCFMQFTINVWSSLLGNFTGRKKKPE